MAGYKGLSKLGCHKMMVVIKCLQVVQQAKTPFHAALKMIFSDAVMKIQSTNLTTYNLSFKQLVESRKRQILQKCRPSGPPPPQPYGCHIHGGWCLRGTGRG